MIEFRWRSVQIPLVRTVRDGTSERAECSAEPTRKRSRYDKTFSAHAEGSGLSHLDDERHHARYRKLVERFEKRCAHSLPGWRRSLVHHRHVLPLVDI